MTWYTNTVGGQLINPSQLPYSSVSLNQNITLYWGSEYVDFSSPTTNYIVAAEMDIIPTQNGYTLSMPDATLGSVGQGVLLNNPSAYSFSLKDNQGNLITNLAAGNLVYIWLINNTTQGGQWRQSIYPGMGAVTQITLNVPTSPSSSNLTVTNGTITSAGTISLGFSGDLLSLISFGFGSGIAVRTAVNTWSLTSIIGTNNQITVTNGNGVAGSPAISLSPNITGVNSLVVGNLNLSGNTITPTNANGNLDLLSIGSGNIILDPGNIILINGNMEFSEGQTLKFDSLDGDSGYISFSASNMGTDVLNLYWPANVPTAGQVIAYAAGGYLVWASAPTIPGTTVTNSLAKYSNTAGGLGETSILVDGSNNMTGVNSIAAGNISIGMATPNTIISTNSNGNIDLAPNGSGLIQLQGPTTIQNGYTFSFYNIGNVNNIGMLAPISLGSNYNLTLPPNAGSANALMQSDGTGVLTFSTLTSVYATKAIMQAATSTTNPVVPSTFNQSPYALKATISFTVAGGGIMITASNNISSATYVSVGEYLIAFTTVFANTNYTYSGGLSTNNSWYISAVNTGSVIINVKNFSGTVQDSGGTFIFTGSQ